MSEDRVKTKSIDDCKYNYDPLQNKGRNISTDIIPPNNAPLIFDETLPPFSQTQYSQESEQELFKEHTQPFIPNVEDAEIQKIKKTINTLEHSLDKVEKSNNELLKSLKIHLKKGIEDFEFERDNRVIKIHTHKIYPELFEELNAINVDWCILPYNMTRISIHIKLKTELI